MPEITTFFGVKLFHSVPSVIVTESDRSKKKKNQETASRLAFKCKKLKRLDHWEDGRSKVIILSRKDGGEKYLVRLMRREHGFRLFDRISVY